MPRISAGLLMYRRPAGALEVLLVHPGGPFWKNKDLGAWSIPKGEAGEGEDLLAAARREFTQELGFAPPEGGPFLPLGEIRQKAGKVVHAWAFEGDCDPKRCQSNTTRLEWPARSGRWITFPEVDRASFFEVGEARRRLNPGQEPLLERLVDRIGGAQANPG
jgi:predicted NUDIX family NTP pyrophosphohydrolase